MSTATIANLLEQDVDDLTSTANDLEPKARNELLTLAAKALIGPAQPTRLKLLRFVQALAAAGNYLTSPELEEITIGLITAAHVDDPTERLAALRALAVVVLEPRKWILDSRIRYSQPLNTPESTPWKRFELSRMKSSPPITLCFGSSYRR
jgi:hypothetical protein